MQRSYLCPLHHAWVFCLTKRICLNYQLSHKHSIGLSADHCSWLRMVSVLPQIRNLGVSINQDSDVLVAMASSQYQENGICIFYQEASVPLACCIATCKGISAFLRCSIDGYMIKCCLFIQRMHWLWTSITLQFAACCH